MSDTTPSSESATPTHSKALSLIFVFLFVACDLTQIYNIYRWKGKWMLAMTIGCFTYAIGVGTISSNLSAYFIFTTLSGAGTGIVIAQVNGLHQVGRWLLLGGLALQLISFLFFSWIVVMFIRRLRLVAPDKVTRDRRLTWRHDGVSLIWGLVLSCFAIVVRSVYRVVQFAIEGDNQSLDILGGLSSDAFFYLLDALPMLVAVSTSTILWPGRFITAESMARAVALILFTQYSLVMSDSVPSLKSLAPAHTKALVALFVLFFVACTLVQAYNIYRWRGIWMLPMMIGCFVYAIGVGSIQHNLSTHFLFAVVLGPCAIIAAECILLVRLARHLHALQHLAIDAGKVAGIFLLSDFFAFAMQAVGTGIAIARKKDLHDLGRWTRSAYRVAQFAIDGDDESLGFLGHFSTDVFFYLLDAIPLLVVVVINVVMWPGRFITVQSMAMAPGEEEEMATRLNRQTLRREPSRMSEGPPRYMENGEDLPHYVEDG
ncbi:hypothetical protein VTO73DRAFT_9686 [Trametes versicolor]